MPMTEEEIWEKIATLKQGALSAWLNELPAEEAIEVTRKMGAMMRKIPLYNESKEFREQLMKAEESTAVFEDIVLQEQVNKLKHEVILENHVKKVDESFKRLRHDLLNAIKAKPEDAEAIKELARGIVKIEKEHDQFNPDDWKEWEGII